MRATEDADFSVRGYLQANAIYSLGDVDFLGGRLDSTGAGIAFAIGSRLSPWYSLEIEVQWSRIAGTLTTNAANAAISFSQTTEIEVDQTTFIANGKIYPFVRSGFRVQPYAKIGLGLLSIDSSLHDVVDGCLTSGECFTVDSRTQESNYGFAMRFGGGGELMVSENFYFYVDYAYTKAITDAIDGDDWHSVGGGVGYLF